MQIVTISRGSLTATHKFAELLSEKLSVPIITREMVLEEADKYSIHDTGFTDISYIDRSPSVWERQYYKKKHYLLAFQTALLDLMSEDTTYIYEGHLGQHLLIGIPFVLSLRILKPIERRIQSWMKYSNSSYEDAGNYIRLIDERRRNWSEFLYGINLEDPINYDLVVNFDVMTYKTFVNSVVLLLDLPEFHSNPDTIIQFKNVHLAALAKTFLYLSPLTRGLDVDITGDVPNKSIKISGVYDSQDQGKIEIHVKSVLQKLGDIVNIQFAK